MTHLVFEVLGRITSKWGFY